MNRIVTIGLGVALAAACKPAAKAPAGPTKVATVDSLQTPESVLWDATTDMYFVSNINGNPSVKDNNGFISRVKPDGVIDSLHFIQGGRGGVTLNAPKGLAVRGDTLWVTDIDAVRAFSARTGAPIASTVIGVRVPPDQPCSRRYASKLNLAASISGCGHCSCSMR